MALGYDSLKGTNSAPLLSKGMQVAGDHYSLKTHTTDGELILRPIQKGDIVTRVKDGRAISKPFPWMVPKVPKQ